MSWSLVSAIIVAAGIPSAVIGFLITRLNKKIDQREATEEEREQARIKNDTMIIQLIMASLELGEATAEAVQRIPDAHCNGDMGKALKNAKRVRSQYHDFEHEQTVKAVSLV